MKRYCLLFFVVAMLAATLASSSWAVFPVRDGTVTLRMYQGWYNDNEAWYITTDTSDINWAKWYGLTLAPKLSSFAPVNISRAMIVVTNPAMSQGPIFSQRPGGASYSGLWQVVYVTWKPGEIKRPITNNQPANAGNPYGIPIADVIIQETDIVVDFPIVALGRLGGPWLAKPDPPFYRIKQGITHNPAAKTITLPYWNIFCDNPVTHAIHVERVIIPDVGTTALAALLGANLAPRLQLAAGPISDMQRFWVQRSPKPPSQLPVIEDCPEPFGPTNTNYGYSPVMRYSGLARTGIAPWTVVNNDTYLLALIAGGQLTLLSQNQRINAPVIP